MLRQRPPCPLRSHSFKFNMQIVYRYAFYTFVIAHLCPKKYVLMCSVYTSHWTGAQIAVHLIRKAHFNLRITYAKYSYMHNI